MSRELIIHNLSFIIRRSRGFTLIELMVAISISIALGLLGIAGFNNYSQAQTLQTSTNEIVTMLNLAKSRAQSQVKLSCTGILKGYGAYILSDAKTYKLFAFCNIGSVVGEPKTLPKNVSFTSGTDRTIFFPIQTGAAQFFIGTVLPTTPTSCSTGNCVITLSSGGSPKTITVNSLGTISVQ